MFAVEIYAAVRRFVFVEGKSRREAARVFGLSRDTISKMCRYSAPPGYVRSKQPERPKLGPLVPVIDAILEADKTAPPKQRHTAKRIFERLRLEHGYAGGYTVVKDYVRIARSRSREAFVPLAHPPGHAQVDFGECIGVIGGVRMKLRVFCFDLPQSDACFIKAYPAETTEAFLDGHVSAIAFFSGVPALPELPFEPSDKRPAKVSSTALVRYRMKIIRRQPPMVFATSWSRASSTRSRSARARSPAIRASMAVVSSSLTRSTIWRSSRKSPARSIKRLPCRTGHFRNRSSICGGSWKPAWAIAANASSSRRAADRDLSRDARRRGRARRDPARRHQLRCGQATRHRQGRTQARKPRSRPSLSARHERQDNLGRRLYGSRFREGSILALIRGVERFEVRTDQYVGIRTGVIDADREIAGSSAPSRQLMRGITYKLQERPLGGLSKSIMRKLERLNLDSEACDAQKPITRVTPPGLSTQSRQRWPRRTIVAAC